MDQEQVQSDSNPLDPIVPSSSTVGEGSISTLGIDLIPFMPMEGEEVPLTLYFMTKRKRELSKELKRRWTLGVNQEGW